MKCVLIYSGGMDSTVLLYDAIRKYDKVYPVSFNYGQRHSVELERAKYFCDTLSPQVEPLKVLDVQFMKDIGRASSLLNSSIDVAKAVDTMGDPQTVNYVPFRNMMFLTIGCSYAETVGADVVLYGAAQVDSLAGYWDGSEEFLKYINDLVNLNRRHKIKILAPLIDKSKEDIINLGIQHGVQFEKTHTCYNGLDLACGECPACSLRIQGFLDAGYIDPIKYKINIPWSTYGCKEIK